MKAVESIADARERLLIPVKEASRWLGMSPFTLYSWAQSHRIPHYKIGKRVMFSREDLKRWLDRLRVTEAG
jgi:excisionase family DNA binding protein